MNRLTSLRKELGFKTIKAFADYTGIKYGTAHKWENRGNLPDAMSISVICAKFPSINPKYFAGTDEPMFNYTPVQQIEPDPLSARTVPIYGKVTAGDTIGLWNYNSEPKREMVISHERIDGVKEHIYGFTVYGDSMRDRFRDGDEVAAIQLDFETKKPRDGDIVVVFMVSDFEIIEPNIKLFQWLDKNKGDFILKSINPYFKDMVKNKKDITKIFRVIFNISFVDYRENRA